MQPIQAPHWCEQRYKKIFEQEVVSVNITGRRRFGSESSVSTESSVIGYIGQQVRAGTRPSRVKPSNRCARSRAESHLLLPPGHVGGLLGIKRVGDAPQDEDVDLKFGPLLLLLLLLDSLPFLLRLFILLLLLLPVPYTVPPPSAAGVSRCAGPPLRLLLDAARPSVPLPWSGGCSLGRISRKSRVGLPAAVLAG